MASTRPITMKDVALAAGVSEATVSRALRNSQNLKSETCKRIQALAQEMNYVPNPMVSALMGQIKAGYQSPTKIVLAFVSAWETRDAWAKTPDFKKYFEGAKKRAEDRGYEMEHFWLNEPKMTPNKFSKMLLTRNIQGILLCPQPAPRATLQLDWSQFSAVTLGYTLLYPDLPRITSNHHAAMELVLSNLKRLGYQRIGIALTAASDERTQHFWLGEYLVHSAGMSASGRVKPFVSSRFSEDRFHEWFKKEKPDAVIAVNKWPLEWIRKANLKVPEDIGFANLSSGHADMEISGIDQHSDQVGAAATDLLTAMLQRSERGIPPLPKLMLIPGAWREGKTTCQQPGVSNPHS